MDHRPIMKPRKRFEGLPGAERTIVNERAFYRISFAQLAAFGESFAVRLGRVS
ncbi:hypothetical protein [Cohnella caldifontis]|uniref:hypothetical protein n=1 Tax=Cohnella caldifontis TaxID=3027471 RepID=UPI0023EDA9B6|nr:hypothetical protein [Cohnella sp. YIM B05605]